MLGLTIPASKTHVTDNSFSPSRCVYESALIYLFLWGDLGDLRWKWNLARKQTKGNERDECSRKAIGIYEV